VFARICTCRAPTSWCDARGACARAWRAQTPYDVASLQDRILINISFEYLASLVLTCSRPYKIGVFLDAYGLEGCNTCTYLATRVCALRVEFLLSWNVWILAATKLTMGCWVALRNWDKDSLLRAWFDHFDACLQMCLKLLLSTNFKRITPAPGWPNDWKRRTSIPLDNLTWFGCLDDASGWWPQWIPRRLSAAPCNLLR
jgi:hypothetical protein